MKRMLHLGCGPIHFPNVNGTVEWINIDKEPSSACDICEDYLNLSTLYEPGTIDGIYTCHSIEHLDYPTGVVRFFEQCFKVLQPGGILRILVPDLMKGIGAYLDANEARIKGIKGCESFGIYSPDDGTWYHKQDSLAERFHFFMTGWQHRMVFDYYLLDLLARDAGFNGALKSVFGKSLVPEFTGLDRFESESVCVECAKP